MDDDSKKKRKILPKPGKRQSLEVAMKRTHEQYGETFRRLAIFEEEEKRRKAEGERGG